MTKWKDNFSFTFEGAQLKHQTSLDDVSHVRLTVTYVSELTEAKLPSVITDTVHTAAHSNKQHKYYSLGRITSVA